jgi:hypothetical protein
MPYALGVASWWGALASLAVLAAVTLLRNSKPVTYAGAPPTGEELALAFLGYMCGGAVCAFVGLTIYLIVKVLFDLITLVGLDVSAWTYAAATWLSLVLALLLLLTIAFADAREILTKLYPAQQGQRSPFAVFLAQPKRPRFWAYRIGGAAAIVIVTIALFRTGFVPAWGYGELSGALAVEIAILVLGVDFWSLQLPKGSEPVLQIQELLMSAGYQVRLYPRTGDREADPLVGLIDFLAIRPDHAIAGRVLTDVSPKELQQEAASLQPALWALEDRLPSTDRSRIRIEPTIVVVGGSLQLNSDPEISASIDRMSVRIVRAPAPTELEAIIRDSDTDRKIRTARALFDPDPGIDVPAPFPITAPGTATS